MPSWCSQGYKFIYIIPAPNLEKPHFLWENLENVSIFPALISIFPRREPSYAARVLFQSCWSCLPTLLTSKDSEKFQVLKAPFLHFACAPLYSSYYNRMSRSFMPTNMLAEMLLLSMKLLHKVFFSQCHYPFLSLLTPELSFIGLVHSLFCSTFFDYDRFPFYESMSSLL